MNLSNPFFLAGLELCLGPKVIELFCPYITDFCNKLVFVIGKLFQSSLKNTLAYCENL
jgi:hypothetical protein